MENKNKRQIAYLFGALSLLVGFGLATLNNPSLYQGDLSKTHFAASEQNGPTVRLSVPTHQIRQGLMPFLKISIDSSKDYALQKMKISLQLKNLSIEDFRLIRNKKDITHLLNDEGQEVFTKGFQAQKRTVSPMLILEFSQPLQNETNSDIYELRLVADDLTKDSLLESSIIDLVVEDERGLRIIPGPEGKTSLETTYF